MPEINYPVDEIAAASNDRDKFMVMYPFLRDSLLKHFEDMEQPAEAVAWIREMMDYTVPGGKLNRGITVLAVYKTLLDRDLTPLETARAAVLGWALEFLQAFFLVADDLMDDSKTRRGQPCWYQLSKVKKIAVNDSFILESCVFTLLTEHFESETYFTKLVTLFLQVVQQTECGQLLDLTTQPQDGPVDLNRFTMERYSLIVKYKTAFYSFYLPVALGMIIYGIKEQEAFNLAKVICCKMGEYFQIQDDFLDCYGDPETIGKIGTDIQENKCSWLVVQALSRVNDDQKKIIEDNYGQWDDEKVAKVKALYSELDVKSIFDKYEDESYKTIQSDLDKVTLMPKGVFEFLLKKIYKRSK